MRRGICLAAVFAPGDGARAPQLPTGRDSPWECWRLGVWDLGKVRTGCASLLRMPSSSPGLHPSADAGVWVTARDTNNSRYSLLVFCVF